MVVGTWSTANRKRKTLHTRLISCACTNNQIGYGKTRMSLIRMLGIYLLDSNVHCVICLIHIVQWINQIKLESFFIPRGIHSNIKHRLTRMRLIAINWFLFCSFVEVSLIHYAAKMQHFSQMFFSFSLTSPCAVVWCRNRCRKLRYVWILQFSNNIELFHFFQFNGNVLNECYTNWITANRAQIELNKMISGERLLENKKNNRLSNSQEQFFMSEAFFRAGSTWSWLGVMTLQFDIRNAAFVCGKFNLGILCRPDTVTLLNIDNEFIFVLKMM